MFMGYEVKAVSPLFMVLFGVWCGKVYDGVVPGAGIEPALPNGNKILSLACLPISPPGQPPAVYHECSRIRPSCMQLATNFPLAEYIDPRV